MKRWEYKEARARDGLNQEELNKLGAEGWELVETGTTLYGPFGPTIDTYIFKREVDMGAVCSRLEEENKTLKDKFEAQYNYTAEVKNECAKLRAEIETLKAQKTTPTKRGRK